MSTVYRYIAAGAGVIALVAALPMAASADTTDGRAAGASCVSDKYGPAGDLLAKNIAKGIDEALQGRESVASVALYDRKHGISCTYDENRQQDAASVIKTAILGALLFQNKGPLTGDDDTLARKMITASDNASATTLWRKLSDLTNPSAPNPVKIQEFLDRVGMKNTVLDKEGFWGLSQVTAADQLQLLKVFTDNSDTVLTPDARAYALDLMNKVQSDQRWGTPAGAPKNAVVHVKNGWLQRSNNPDVDPYDRLDWKVNSMAAFTGDDYDYGLVVLTENNRVPAGHPAQEGWTYGIGTIEGVARAVHHGLYPLESPSQDLQPSLQSLIKQLKLQPAQPK
ncbi:class A beta-lactamase-related serine hydrolase [Streptomyces acidiscabies]|uniref:class A beta-lactamase-related serine hydrolase n=1 Tax=Streptomyces acidiscabies TaxID=42234 RepID=UPI000B2B438D|nr:class A beta-lactamase-related serine hydrolase [Streptomyces acidiscabies]